MTTYCFKCKAVRRIATLKDIGPIFADDRKKRVVASEQKSGLACTHQKVIVTKVGARA